MAKPKTILGQSLELRARIEFLEEALKESKGVVRKLKKDQRDTVKSHMDVAAFAYAHLVDHKYSEVLDRLKGMMDEWTKELASAKKKLKKMDRKLRW